METCTVSNDDAVGRLLAVEEIHQLKARYCRLIDEKNWAELEELFAPDAHIEIAGGPGGAQDVQRFSTSREFVRGLQALMEPLRTVHQVTNPEIILSSEESASGIWAVADRLSFPEGSPTSVLQGYGHYREKYAKADGRWIITDLRLTRLLVEATP
jgi:hypothetical protein